MFGFMNHTREKNGKVQNGQSTNFFPLLRSWGPNFLQFFMCSLSLVIISSLSWDMISLFPDTTGSSPPWLQHSAWPCSRWSTPLHMSHRGSPQCTCCGRTPWTRRCRSGHLGQSNNPSGSPLSLGEAPPQPACPVQWAHPVQLSEMN